MPMIVVLALSIVVAGVCLVAARQLDRSPGHEAWKSLWQEAFSGELAVLAGWWALHKGRRPASSGISAATETRSRRLSEAGATDQ